ncbi:bactofilin family protein [Rhodoferax saidenbachensis]|jgi:cytoskeletal protein CcmA (bactofilin family)|uniref:Cell shape determination protein CcmA n=1 Tax=Rhodoferax saidenbachensis TaxID=1484693 RepID=A0A1P8K6R1_9BURK|nr:polymer-forming cytoskeletal protein [Rhodoferax saidenbachensis]APW41705.1 cell shape determination protein CcmA [Rhodoferax saidenbachensis]
MFNKKKQPPIKSLIAEGSRITGDISFADGLRVDGDVTGNIRASDEVASILVISESAKVIGEVVADHIIINGSVKGPVHARLMLELQPKARIEGDVQYAALEMHQGALIAGQLRPIILGEEEKPTLKLAANNQ